MLKSAKIRSLTRNVRNYNNKATSGEVILDIWTDHKTRSNGLGEFDSHTSN